MRRFAFLLLISAPLWLAGCDLLGIEPASAIAAHKEAEGKAVGGACRHAGRAIEDCYGLNKRADKAAVFAGWREMNDYMRENKIEAVPPQSAEADGETVADAGEPEEAKPEGKADGKAAKKTAKAH